MRFVLHDGGRHAAGYRGQTGDCVTRAIAIAAQMPYPEAYALVNEMCKEWSPRSPLKYGNDSARRGVSKKTCKRIIEMCLQWDWHPTIRHLTCVIDGVIYDTHDPSRDGNRCVYGYWTAPCP